MAVQPIPDGYQRVTPYLIVDDPARQIAFLEAALDARQTGCHTHPDGAIMHAEVEIGDSRVMMGRARGEFAAMPATLYVYVEDVDSSYRRALEVGATSISEPADQFYGDRSAGVRDPLGNCWWLATHVEDVSPGEMARRAASQAAAARDH